VISARNWLNNIYIYFRHFSYLFCKLSHEKLQIIGKCYFVFFFMSNTNHLCRNLLDKGLKDQRRKKKVQLSSP